MLSVISTIFCFFCGCWCSVLCTVPAIIYATYVCHYCNHIMLEEHLAALMQCLLYVLTKHCTMITIVQSQTCGLNFDADFDVGKRGGKAREYCTDEKVWEDIFKPQLRSTRYLRCFFFFIRYPYYFRQCFGHFLVRHVMSIDAFFSAVTCYYLYYLNYLPFDFWQHKFGLHENEINWKCLMEGVAELLQLHHLVQCYF